MRRSILNLNKKWFKNYVLVLLSISVILFGIFSIYFFIYSARICPNVNIANIKVGGLSATNANSLLISRVTIPQKIQLVDAGELFSIDLKDFDFSYDYQGSVQKAFGLTRTGDVFHDTWMRIVRIFQPVNIGLNLNFNNDKLDKIISIIHGQVSVDPVDPSIKLTDGAIVIDKGKAGTEVDLDLLKNTIIENLSQGNSENIQIPINTIDRSLSQTETDNLKLRAEKYIGKSFQLKFEFNTYTLTDTDLLKLLEPKLGFDDKALDLLFQNYSDEINREPQNPKFIFENNRVTEFQPALDGIRVDEEVFKNNIVFALGKIENNTEKVVLFDVPVLRTPPDVTTDKINNLGIKELIGRGTSTYFHSIPSRVHNVILATSRINGTLIRPGDTFSFNDTLGDVSAFTGYQQAYIISDGKTILGDGGGVCQVSTTLFRSVLNAGLPVIERQAHAYRVGYYEQGSPPGLDATVYGPSPDFKFLNDTPAYILIQATADAKNYSLVFELYGTKDGRVATTSKPVVTNVSAPAGDVYQDDPTLPAGTVKQIEYKAWGARVTFNYLVTRNGAEIYKKTFISNYRPWQAVYLRGTAN